MPAHIPQVLKLLQLGLQNLLHRGRMRLCENLHEPQLPPKCKGWNKRTRYYITFSVFPGWLYFYH